MAMTAGSPAGDAAPADTLPEAEDIFYLCAPQMRLAMFRSCAEHETNDEIRGLARLATFRAAASRMPG
ncbi:hypothetical protein GVO57_06540 [Sphingomonas changnyeongensis]|uniref:Uncharacterized protein n=1 Tax=Sphingomonas changnyeongensis TaxID=2698679 RepID=A0A7Z2NWB8_9SPHN|nr:hypothetical protein [Sphingomonas changnyeongensis]QHL90550.1 hypothetical protein GVO57_06540 [Sphingomonas changnyeongensis]